MSEHQATLVDILPAHAFDIDALQHYVESACEKTFNTFTVRQFQGGQSNPTFLIDADIKHWVLRKKPNGKLLPSAHMINREYQVMEALHPTAVPVPAMTLYCEDPRVIGTEFYLMDYVPGMLIEHPALHGVSPAHCHTLYENMATTLAALHKVDINAVGLQDYARSTADYYARQIKRWSEQYRQASAVPGGGKEGANAMHFLMEYLPNHIPADDTTCLVHGDYRVGNLLINEDDFTIAAVLDWELSTLGHPLADLAYCCIPYHLPSEQEGVKGLLGTDLKARGIPSEAAFIDMYCRACGRDGVENWPFYVAFSLFRLASICQGVYARALQGNASSANALAVGSRAALLAITARNLLTKK